MMIPLLRIANIIDCSIDANGPGRRTVIWFSGCQRACKGCINKHLWDANSGTSMSVRQIIDRVRSNISKYHITGVTISGGEPFEQKDGVKVLLYHLKEIGQLDTLVYTGFVFDELYPADYSSIDILIDGPFMENLKNIGLKWRGSDNQKVLVLNKDVLTKYPYDFDFSGRVTERPSGQEFIVSENGEIQATGIGFDAHDLCEHV